MASFPGTPSPHKQRQEKLECIFVHYETSPGNDVMSYICIIIILFCIFLIIFTLYLVHIPVRRSQFDDGYIILYRLFENTFIF